MNDHISRNELSSAQPDSKELSSTRKALDTISRQAAIDALNGEINITGRANAEAVRGYVRLVKDRLERLPSAQPERKTGHWIKTARWGRVYYCDQCRNYLDFDGVNAGRGSANFCPNCGADMRGEGEQNE